MYQQKMKFLIFIAICSLLKVACFGAFISWSLQTVNCTNDTNIKNLPETQSESKKEYPLIKEVNVRIGEGVMSTQTIIHPHYLTTPHTDIPDSYTTIFVPGSEKNEVLIEPSGKPLIPPPNATKVTYEKSREIEIDPEFLKKFSPITSENDHLTQSSNKEKSVDGIQTNEKVDQPSLGSKSDETNEKNNIAESGDEIINTSKPSFNNDDANFKSDNTSDNQKTKKNNTDEDIIPETRDDKPHDCRPKSNDDGIKLNSNNNLTEKSEINPSTVQDGKNSQSEPEKNE